LPVSGDRGTSVGRVAAVSRAGHLLLPGRAQGGEGRAQVALVLLAHRPRRWSTRVRRVTAPHCAHKYSKQISLIFTIKSQV